MRKSDLRNGDVVQYPNGDYRLYIKGMGFFNPVDYGFASEDFLDEDLCLDGEMVKAVYRLDDAYDVNEFFQKGAAVIDGFKLIYPSKISWMKNPEEKIAEGMLFEINDPDEAFEKMVLMQVDSGLLKLFSPGECNRVSDEVFSMDTTLKEFNKKMAEMGYEIKGMKRNAQIVFVVE